MRPAVSIVVLAAVCTAACIAPTRWRTNVVTTPGEAEALLSARSSKEAVREFIAEDIPDVPMRQRLRPCCGFGSGVKVRLGVVPVPMFEIPNVIGPEDVGPHGYDSGMLVLEPTGKPTVDREKNGLLVTCRGGVIDTGHIRDYADWALFLMYAFARSLDDGTEIVFPNEGGRRWITMRPIPKDLRRQLGADRIAIELGVWAAFELSVWHEIATWYGWTAVPGSPETSSAFSPEDLYSNLLGAKITGALTYTFGDVSDERFARGVDAWIPVLLGALEALPRETAVEVMMAIDQRWWDSKARWPDKGLVLRRNFDLDDPLLPWVPPEEVLSPELRAEIAEHCTDGFQPQPLLRMEALDGFRFSDYVTLHFEVDDRLAKQEPFTEIGRTVTQADYPVILEAIRRQNAEEFGPEADRP